MQRKGEFARGRSAVVILTDFGQDSFYVGTMKGVMLAVDPGAVIVDLTHRVRPYAVDNAGFVLSAVFDFWAEGTVFLVVVDPGVGGERQNLVVESRGRWIVCPDNGLVSDVAARFGVDGVFAVTEEAVAKIRKHRAVGRTFLGRDVFGPVAAFLASGGEISRVGTKIDEYRRIPLPKIEVHEGYICGQGRYVDDFGNILTNILGDDIERAFPHTSLAEMRVSINNSVGVNGIRECFSQGVLGELVVVLDSWGLLEVSVNQGRAVDRFPDDRPVVVELARA